MAIRIIPSFFFESRLIPSFKIGTNKNIRAYAVKYQYCLEKIGKNAEITVLESIASGEIILNTKVTKIV